MTTSGFWFLQIKTTEASANQIQSNALRLIEQMSITRTQIEGDVRRAQQFIQQVRNFLSGSNVQAHSVCVPVGLCMENTVFTVILCLRIVHKGITEQLTPARLSATWFIQTALGVSHCSQT